MCTTMLTRITQIIKKGCNQSSFSKTFATGLDSLKCVSFKKLRDKDDGVVVLALNSPKNRNALSKQMLHEINETLDQVYSDSSIRALVIRSLVSGVFCAGKDGC